MNVENSKGKHIEVNSYPMAIIGAACYLPGSRNTEEYWDTLLQEKITIAPMPESRFPKCYHSPEEKRRGHCFTNLASLVDIEQFCKETVPKMEQELERNGSTLKSEPHTPGHLLALHVAMEAFRSTGKAPLSFPSRKVGVFCGLVNANDSNSRRPVFPRVECFLEELNRLESFRLFSSSERDDIRTEFLNSKNGTDYCSWRPEFLSSEHPYEVTRLIQQTLRLQGVGFIFDAACSSSLTAIELAQNYLRTGKLEYALVGGLNMIYPGGFVHICDASANSGKGSHPFEERADGLIPGDGCAFVVLKGLDRAIADGDPIQGIVRGIGISSDGRGKGLWAPAKAGQALAMTRAFADSGWASYDELDYIEAHATSTQLGDMTELEALTDSISKRHTSDHKIFITSVKANIGHLLEVAGVGSLSKVLLSLKNKTILRQPHFGEPTAKFDWDRACFLVPVKNTPWTPEGKVRKAMVDGFGIGGLNAQVLLEGPEGALTPAVCPSEGAKDEIPIAIIGMGAILPKAFNVPAFAKLRRTGESATTRLSELGRDLLFTWSEKEESSWPKLCGGFVTGYEYDWRRHRIPPRQIEFANPLQFQILGAADEAIEMAGYCSHLENKDGSRKSLDPEKTAVIVGTRSDSDHYTLLKLLLDLPVFEERLEKILKKRVSESQAKELARSFSARLHEIHPILKDETGSYTISTLASRICKTYDLMGGALSLDSGDVSSFVALENAVNWLRYRSELSTVVTVLGHRSMTQNVFAEYDKKGDPKRVPAEGVVAFILKRLDDAKRDGDPIHGVIRSIDGQFFHDKETESLEIPIPDELLSENRSVLHEEILNGPLPEAVRRHLEKTTSHGTGTEHSVEAQFGDLRPVSGAAALLDLVLRMKEMPADSDPLLILSQYTEDGTFYQILAERYTDESKSVDRSSKEKIVPQSTENEVRTAPLTIQHTTVTNKNDIPNQEFANIMDTNKIVFMFPGQGSQYKQMFQNLFEGIPQMREELPALDSILHRLDFPDFNDLTVSGANLLGKDVFRTQLALLVGDTLLARVFERLGIQPHMVLGHSYGEYPALVASGVWSFETAAWMTRQRCSIIEQCLMKTSNTSTNSTELFNASSYSTMLSTNASAQELTELFEQLWEQTVAESSLFISNRNAPDQMIVSGTRKALTKLELELKKRKKSAIMLPVPAAYHSPLVAEVCAPLRKVLEKVQFSVPQRAILSSVTMKFEADPDNIRDNLVEQMVRPVDFIAMIEKAYRNGVRHFVEVGAKRVLEKLTSKILVNYPDVHLYHCDNGKGGNADEFREICSQLRDVQKGLDSHVSVGIRLEGLHVEAPEVEQVERDPRLDRKASRICEIHSTSGSPRELGRQYGEQCRTELRQTLRRYTDLALMPQSSLLLEATEDQLSHLDQIFGCDGLEELRGMAEGAGVPLDALVRHNLSVFPVGPQDAFTMLSRDRGKLGFVKNIVSPEARRQLTGGNCVQFAGHLSDGSFVHGGNIDIAFTRIVPDSLRYSLVIRKPQGKYPSVSMVPIGLIGSRGGINVHGLCVSTCDLLDTEFHAASTEGLRRGNLIQMILDSCSTLEEVIALVQKKTLCGAKTFAVSDVFTGRIVHFENFGQGIAFRSDRNYLLQANHSLLLKPSSWKTEYTQKMIEAQEKEGSIPKHSLLRYARLLSRLRPSVQGIFALDDSEVFSVLRDTTEFNAGPEKDSVYTTTHFRTMNMILRLDNAYSWLYHQKSGLLQIALTRSPFLSEEMGECSEFFDIRELLPGFAPPVRKGEAESIPANVVPELSIESKPEEKPLEQASVPMRAGDEIFHSRLLSSQEYKRLSQTPPPEQKKLTTGKPWVTTRFVDRLVPMNDLPNEEAIEWRGPVLLLQGKKNRLTQELEKRIRERGGRSVTLSIRREDGSVKEEEPLRKEMCELLAQEPISDIFVITSFDEDDPTALRKENWSDFSESAIYGPIFVLQEWYRTALEQKTLDRVRVVAATRMGGDLGVGGAPSFFEGGAALGFIHGLKYEILTNYRIQTDLFLVDTDPAESKEIVADVLLREFASCRTTGEDIAWRHGKRYAVRMIPETSLRLNKSVFKTTDKKPVWIVTGGARGVTAELALAIGQAFDARLHLIGSSPLSGDPHWAELNSVELKAMRASVVKEALSRKEAPIAAWNRIEKAIEMHRNIKRFINAGLEIEYHVCDLRDLQKTSELIERIRKQEGSITGVLCGAGFESALLFEKKKTENIRRTIDIKVGSVFPILEAFNSAPPKILIGMGSISGRFGSVGQMDYCIANNLLGKTLAHFSAAHTNCRSFLVHWHAWDDAGMAIRPESKLVFQRTGMALMPAAEGCQSLLNEIAIDTVQKPFPEQEVCFTEWKYYRHCFDHCYKEEIPVTKEIEKVSSPKEVDSPETPVKMGPPLPSEISAEVYEDKTDSKKYLARRNAESEPLFDRFVPRLIRTGNLPSGKTWEEGIKELPGAILLVGNNPLTDEISKRLKQAKATVYTLPNARTETELDETISSWWNEKPISFVLFLGAYDTVSKEMNATTWSESFSRSVRGPYRLIRQLVLAAKKSGRVHQLGMAVLTRFGGDFGLSGKVDSPWEAAISGIFKGLRDELHVKEAVYLPFKVVDHDETASPQQIISDLFAEMNEEILAMVRGDHQDPSLLNPEAHQADPYSGKWQPFDYEVGYIRGERYVLRTVPESISSNPDSDKLRLLTNEEQTKGVWLIVGGLRGIMSANALALVRAVLPRKIILVGSRPFSLVHERLLSCTEEELAEVRTDLTRDALRTKQSPIKMRRLFDRELDMTRNLIEFQKLGIEVVYEPVDMRSWSDVETFTQKLKAEGTSVTALLFGAGYSETDASIDSMPLAHADDFICTKVCGLTSLLKNLDPHTLRFVIGFGSISGRFGGNGQIAYTAANDMVAKTLHKWRGQLPNTRVVCMEWCIWGELGISMRPDVRGPLLAAKAIFIPTHLGVQFFMNECGDGLSAPEVLFAPWKYYKRFQPDRISVPLVYDSASSNEKASDARETDIHGEENVTNFDFEGKDLFVFGQNAEAKALLRLAGADGFPGTDDCIDYVSIPQTTIESLVNRLADREVLLLTSPCDPELAKVQSEERYQQRMALVRAELQLIKIWIKARLQSQRKLGRLIILRGKELENSLKYDEAEFIQVAIERLFDSDQISQEERPKIEVVETSLRVAPDLFIRQYFMKEGKIDKSSEEKKQNQEMLLTDYHLLEEQKGHSAGLEIDPKRDVFLQEHQLKGQPILPFVIGTELFLEMGKYLRNQESLKGSLEVHNIKAVRGMICTVEETYNLHCNASRTDERNRWIVRLNGDYYNPKKVLINRQCPYFSAELLFRTDQESLSSPKIPSLANAFVWVPIFPEKNQDRFYHGPSLQKLKRCHILNEKEMVAEIEVPSREELIGSRKTGARSLCFDAAVLDACFWGCGVLNGWKREGISVIPDVLNRIQCLSETLQAGESARAYIRLIDEIQLPAGYRQIVFDFDVYNSRDKLVYKVEGFRMTELNISGKLNEKE